MTRRNQIGLIFLGLLTLAVAARVWFWRGAPPQLLASDEVFKTVDGLFTAVTAHDTKRLAACQERLDKYKQHGALPPAAAKRLDKIIALARDGQWDPAARALYDFMQGQRRDGPSAPALPRQTAMRVNR